MHKIYSRPRIKIPKIIIRRNRSPNKRKIRKMSVIWCILIIAFVTVYIILKSILPIFDELCENRAMSIATIVSNEQATKVMSEHSYDEIFTIEKDTSGNIKMIRSNMVAINQITSDVAIKIQQEIDKEGSEDVEIALRKFYWN